MPEKRRIVMAVLLLPATLPFVLFKAFMEWFHFRVSQRMLHACRYGHKRLDAFFDAL